MTLSEFLSGSVTSGLAFVVSTLQMTALQSSNTAFANTACILCVSATDYLSAFSHCLVAGP